MAVLKYAIAGITPEVMAAEGQAAKLSGSVSEVIGFGKWGIETTTVVEITVPDLDSPKVDKFIRTILSRYRQEAAYRTVDGQNGAILHVTGELEEL